MVISSWMRETLRSRWKKVDYKTRLIPSTDPDNTVRRITEILVQKYVLSVLISNITSRIKVLHLLQRLFIAKRGGTSRNHFSSLCRSTSATLAFTDPLKGSNEEIN